jgi:hypothetical protein
VVKYLVEEEGANLEAADGSGATPLIMAARMNDLEMVFTPSLIPLPHFGFNPLNHFLLSPCHLSCLTSL